VPLIAISNLANSTVLALFQPDLQPLAMHSGAQWSANHKCSLPMQNAGNKYYGYSHNFILFWLR